MLYIPPIYDYKPFYIQFDSDDTATDILDTYGVVVRVHEYPMSVKVKEPYKNEWKDQNGDEEYIGDNGLYYEAFTLTLECAMFANGSTQQDAISYLKGGIKAFQTALSNGFFSIYDSWTGFGFRNVRLDEFPMPGQGDYSVSGKNTRILFSLKLKVNDPATSMTLVNNAIVQG